MLISCGIAEKTLSIKGARYIVIVIAIAIMTIIVIVSSSFHYRDIAFTIF